MSDAVQVCGRLEPECLENPTATAREIPRDGPDSIRDTQAVCGFSCLGTARDEHSATLLNNGKVLIAGGKANPPGGYLASAELYDPATRAFTPTGTMGKPSYLHTATL